MHETHRAGQEPRTDEEVPPTQKNTASRRRVITAQYCDFCQVEFRSGPEWMVEGDEITAYFCGRACATAWGAPSDAVRRVTNRNTAESGELVCDICERDDFEDVDELASHDCDDGGLIADGGDSHYPRHVWCRDCGTRSTRPVNQKHDQGDITTLDCPRCGEEIEHDIGTIDFDGTETQRRARDALGDELDDDADADVVGNLLKRLSTSSEEEDLRCDGCGSTLDVRLVRVVDPDGLITVCSNCEDSLNSTIVEEVDSSQVATDGGRPAFIDPYTTSVTCWLCNETIEPEVAKGIDISGPEEYYPEMRPVCPTHHEFDTAELRDGETRDDDAHARRNAEQLAMAEEADDDE